MITINKTVTKHIGKISSINLLIGVLILTFVALSYSLINGSSISSEIFLAIFTGFMAIFSYLQFRSLNAQRDIIERDYQPDLELYLEGRNRPKLCIHNNGGSSAVRVEVQASNLSDGETYELVEDKAEIPVIEPMETVKVKLDERSINEMLMVERSETLHDYERAVREGVIEKSDLDIQVNVAYRDSRKKEKIITRGFNLIEDQFRGNRIEYVEESKERYIRGIDEVTNSIRGLGTLLADRLD